MSKKALPFTKMHGAGNDFVFMTKEDVRSLTPGLVRQIMDRHFGIGGDQLLYLKSGSPVQLDIFNSDGSKAEMCGNGVRAVANYLQDFKGFKKDFVIETKAGPIGIGLKGKSIEVDMGRPILEGRKIPVKATGEIVDRPLKVGGKTYKINCVSMGNPHCVIFVRNVDEIPLEEIGPKIEHHPFFPHRVNVEFVQIKNRSQIKARVWERGVGATLACGTGACAIAVASSRAGKTQRNVSIELPGGVLKVRWGTNDRVYLSGPTKIVYQGEYHV